MESNGNIKESVEYFKNYISDWSIKDFEEDPEQLEKYFEKLVSLDRNSLILLINFTKNFL